VKFSIREVQQAVRRAQDDVLSAGVPSGEASAVASVVAALQLLGNDGTQAQQASVPMNLTETFAEWAASFNLESHYDRFLAATVYLYDQKQMQSVNTSDVIRIFDNARWEKPKNPADVFAKAAKKMHFTEADSAGEDGLKRWRLTRTGYNYFQSLRKEDPHE